MPAKGAGPMADQPSHPAVSGDTGSLHRAEMVVASMMTGAMASIRTAATEGPALSAATASMPMAGAAQWEYSQKPTQGPIPALAYLKAKSTWRATSTLRAISAKPEAHLR